MTKNKSIFIQNIYYMLSYAFTALNQLSDKKIDPEKFENVHNLFAAILSKGIGQQLKRGIYRKYINITEDTPIVRGKIDLRGTIRNKMANKRILTCEYDELSENNICNQILKATVMLLLRHGDVKPEYKDKLKSDMLLFANVDTIDISYIRWKSITFEQNNQTYFMLLCICRLIIEGMLLTTEQGSQRLASFIDAQQMSHLYEKFILAYYIKEYPTLNIASSQIPWALDDDVSIMLPRMRSDITIAYESKVLVIDAKYYTHTTQVRYDTHTIHSNNLYQIFTYVKNKDSQFTNKPHEVSGLLLYAGTDETVQPDCVYKMSGNKISVRTLDLNQKFSVIAAKMDEIVKDHFGLVKPKSSVG